MSQQSAATSGPNGADTNSEFGRLQRLPGYSRLQRQLFFNLMTARPDVSQQNIRIDHVGRIKQPKSTYGPASHYEDPTPVSVRRFAGQHGYGTGAHPNNNNNSDKNVTAMQRYDSEADLAGDTSIEPALGRATIKNISKLIFERDHNRPIPVIDAASL